MSIWFRYLLAGLLASFSLGTLAADIAPLQQRWAEIQYQLPDNQKSAAFEALAADAEQALAREPNDAPLLIWRGIILSSWAGADGGLGALSKVKEAKSLLEHALQVDPQALQGSARPTPVWARSTIRCRAGRSALVTTSRPRHC